MVTGLFALCLATVLGQVPIEASWLKVVPSDVDLVIHVRGIDSTSDDLVKMLNAMSVRLGQQTEPAIVDAVGHVRERFGEPTSTAPFLVVVKLPRLENANGPPPFAILLKSDDYEGVLRSLAGPMGNPKPEHQAAGFDLLTDENGQRLATYRGDGFVAFQPMGQEMIADIASKPMQNLGATISAELQEHLLNGDVGLYVSLSSVQSKYGEQINQARQGLMAAMDQAAQAGGNQLEAAKAMYDRMFDALKIADGLALNFDFAGEGLTLAGLATVKADSDAATRLKEARRGTWAKLGTLPDDGSFYMYMNADSNSLERLQSLGMASVLGPNAKESPVYKKALNSLKALGPQESYGMASFDDGFKMINLSFPSDPRKAVAASTEMMEAMKGSELIKEFKVEPKALSYKAFDLAKVDVTYDIEKMAQAQPNNPGGAEAIKKMLGGGTMTNWYGTDGKMLISVVAKSAEETKARIDSVLTGEGSIGQSAGFRALRSKLPKEVGILMLLSAQGLVKQMSQVLSTMMAAEARPLGDLPKEPALFGGSLTPTPAGYHFDFVLPSTVGPVFEKGLLPLIQGIQGQVNQ